MCVARYCIFLIYIFLPSLYFFKASATVLKNTQGFFNNDLPSDSLNKSNFNRELSRSTTKVLYI